MGQCTGCGQCNSQKRARGKFVHGNQCTEQTAILIVGNQDSGKTTLFKKITQAQTKDVEAFGLKKMYRGILKGSDVVVFDSPEFNPLFPGREERSAGDILLSGTHSESISDILIVANGKNLKRSIILALQYAEYGLHVMIAMNMVDECEKLGLVTDTQKLSEILGVPVCETVAVAGQGVDQLLSRMGEMSVPKNTVRYSDNIEVFLKKVEELIPSSPLSPRAIGLLLLGADRGAFEYIKEHFGLEKLNLLQELVADCQKGERVPLGVRLGNVYNKKADKIVSEVQTRVPVKTSWLANKAGQLCSAPLTGLPIALGILVAMYYFVGAFGATFLVDSINGTLFQGYLFPFMERLVEPIPSTFIREMIMDPDFGVMTTGVFLALGLVMPVIFCFYIAFGFLEESGYIQRLSILFDRMFKIIGMNGKGVIPLVMGSSCVTMALLTTRIMNSEKEKNIACFLLFLVMPCSPLLAVMLIILNKLPITAAIAVFGILFSQMVVAGLMINKILPGEATPLFLEMPRMRAPKPLLVLRKSLKKTYEFVKEALPVFILASLFVFIFERSGGLEALERGAAPVLDLVLGIPEKSVQVFIKTMVRRESGAAELLQLSSSFTNRQLVTTMIVMTLITPCINAVIVLFKERGGRTAASILVGVMGYAIIVGCLANYMFRFFGIDFI